MIRMVYNNPSLAVRTTSSNALGRFYFDVNDGVEIRDELGRELIDGADVRLEALRVAAALLKAEAEDAAETTLVLSVRDASGSIRLKVRVVCQIEED